MSRQRGEKDKALMPLNKHWGARLKLRRVFLNASRADVAEGLGFAGAQLEKYELGDNRLFQDRTFQLSEKLGVPYEYLFFGLKFLDAVPTDEQGRQLDIVTNFINELAKNKNEMKLRSELMEVSQKIASMESQPQSLIREIIIRAANETKYAETVKEHIPDARL